MFGSVKRNGDGAYLVILQSHLAGGAGRKREVARLGRVDHLTAEGQRYVVDDLNDVLRRTRQPVAKRAGDLRQRGVAGRGR